MVLRLVTVEEMEGIGRNRTERQTWVPCEILDEQIPLEAGHLLVDTQSSGLILACLRLLVSASRSGLSSLH